MKAMWMGGTTIMLKAAIPLFVRPSPPSLLVPSPLGWSLESVAVQ